MPKPCVTVLYKWISVSKISCKLILNSAYVTTSCVYCATQKYNNMKKMPTNASLSLFGTVYDTYCLILSSPDEPDAYLQFVMHYSDIYQHKFTVLLPL